MNHNWQQTVRLMTLSFSTCKKSEVDYIYDRLIEQQDQIKNLTDLIGRIVSILERVV